MLFRKFQQETCPNCGAHEFKRLQDGTLKCEYCDSILQASLNHNKEEFPNKSISGDMQKFSKYIVYGKMIVTGDMNKIKLSKNLTKGIQVNNLIIKGDMNKGKVALVDGATYEVKGDMNEVK